MSRFIKSAETLKARAGKQVKVNGEIFNVTVHTDTIGFDNEKNSFSIVNSPVCIERFLSKNRVASAGYKFKHTSKAIEGFIFNKECLVTVKPETGKWQDEVHTVPGMLVKERGDWYLLSNEKALDGSAPGDTKDYKYGWYVSCKDLKDQEVVLKTEMLSGVVEEVEKDPLVRIAMALEDIATYLSRMSK